MFIQEVTSSNAPKAIGPYSPGIQIGDFIYFSGQIPLKANGEFVDGDIKAQTTQVLENIKALLNELGLETRHIVKTTVFMTDLAEFNDMNEVYSQYFSNPYPARSCIQVAGLPKNAKVEIECLIIDTAKYEEVGSCDSGDCGGCSGDCGCSGF